MRAAEAMAETAVMMAAVAAVMMAVVGLAEVMAEEAMAAVVPELTGRIAQRDLPTLQAT